MIETTASAIATRILTAPAATAMRMIEIGMIEIGMIILKAEEAAGGAGNGHCKR